MASTGTKDERPKRTGILPFHLPKDELSIFTREDNIATKKIESMFTAWMECNSLYPEARTLRYAEFPSKWTWHQGIKAWRPRLRKVNKEFRIVNVPPHIGEAYYLRRLLDVIRGPTSFEDIRTVGGVVHETFTAACAEHGLLAEDDQAEG